MTIFLVSLIAAVAVTLFAGGVVIFAELAYRSKRPWLWWFGAVFVVTLLTVWLSLWASNV